MGSKEEEPEAPSLGRGGQVPAGATVQELDAEECWTLLRKHTLGRLARRPGGFMPGARRSRGVPHPVTPGRWSDVRRPPWRRQAQPRRDP